MIDATGTARWATNGIVICAETNWQSVTDLISDMAGGAIIVWQDMRDSSGDIYAQRVDSLGADQWATNGIMVHQVGTEYQDHESFISDGSGGMIIAWSDRRNGVGNMDIFVQRIDHDGNWRWVYSGVPICTAAGDQEIPRIASDGEGGYFLAWRDGRYTSDDIYAQHLRSDGVTLWPDDGIDVCTYEEDQSIASVTEDGYGGLFLVWRDHRNTYNNHAYAQRIEPKHGHWGVPEPFIAFATDIAPDEGGYVDLSWYGSQLDSYMYGEVTHYSIWRASNPVPMFTSPGESPVLTALQDVGKDFNGSAIRFEQAAAGDFFWEWIANADALGLGGYSYATPTRTDSTASDPAMHYFQVVTHTQTPTTYWVSASDSGYSVDNLSPCPPAAAAAQQTYAPEGLEITWEPNTEPDLGCYMMHRGISSDFVPGGGNLVYSECDEIFFDSEWRWDNQYWYKLAAVDIHGNVSEYVLLGPGYVTGDETPETPQVSYLSQNYPNPFNPATIIRFGLESRGDVSLRIYDPAGRLVRILVEESRDAGHYTEEWDGRDREGRRVASGMYFYSLQTDAFKETRKMVLVR
jgi:hypothetical protein